MKIIEVNPSHCKRWKYADRSSFEFGDVTALAEDIKQNGQIEPAIVREINDNDFKYEVIAGSRRLQACCAENIPFKVVINNVDDVQAAIIQTRENSNLPISDYSKGMHYRKLLDDQAITQEQLAESLSISRRKLRAYLYFADVDSKIWKAVNNMSKVSPRTAETIYLLSQKGDEYKDALIELADEIKKGVGSTRLTNMVDNLLLGTDKPARVI